jgi:hypothetical protein
MKPIGNSIQILSWIVIGTLMLVIATSLSERNLPMSAYEWPDRKKEGFESKGEGESSMVYYRDQPQMDHLGSYLEWEKASDKGLTGQDPLLHDRTKPYVLLDDTLSVKKGQVPNTKESSNTCYQSDFRANTTKVGNYVQRTNNYKHDVPDSCSAPIHELVGNFYEMPSL